MAQAPRTDAAHDNNRTSTLLGVSTVDGKTPVPVEVDPTNGQLQVSSTGGGGGGGAVTIADGADVAQGTTTDTAWSSGAGTVISLLKKIAAAGGSAVSISDGSDVAQGTTTDTAYVSGSGTIVSVLKGIFTKLSSALTVTQGTAASLTGGWPTINGEIGDVTGTFTNATQTTSVTATGLDGYGNTLISINGTYGTATAVFEGSDDGGTTWYAVQAARDNSNTIELGYTSLTNTSQTWQINNPGFDSLRVRSTAVASGTVNVRLSSSAAPVASGTIIGLGTSIPTGTNSIGAVTETTLDAAISTSGAVLPGNYVAMAMSDGSNLRPMRASLGDGSATNTSVGVNPMVFNGSTYDRPRGANAAATTSGTGLMGAGSMVFDGTNWQKMPGTATAVTVAGSINLSPTASGGWTPYFANAITTTVAPTSAAGKFGGYMLINLNSVPAYLQVFDTTGAVTLGSTAPTFVIPIPANGTAANGLAANVELANGIVIANGIKCAATTTSTGASTVSTGLSGTLWVK